MSELRVFTIATIFLFIIGGILPLVVGSFDNTSYTLTGSRLTIYNFLSGGVDLTGSYDIPNDDSVYDFLVGWEMILSEFPLFGGILYLYLFILLYTIVKALPFT